MGWFTAASSVLVERHWWGGVGFSSGRENPTFASHGVRPPPRRLPNKKNDKSYGIPWVSVVCGIVCQNLGGLVGPPATMRGFPGIPLGSRASRPALVIGYPKNQQKNQENPNIPKATCLFPLAAGLFGYLKTSGIRYDFQ